MQCAQLTRAVLKAGWASLRIAVIAVAGALMASCAFVDAYGSRVYQNNLTFQDVNSQEALLNIVRASRHEALSFVLLGQETGTQTETLTNGLPTFTLGPGQTAAQRQFAFGGNTLASAASGGFQVSPLVSAGFMQGMLTPITPKTLALLVGTYPRPWMYYAVIDGIKLISTDHKLVYYFHNDPADDQYDGVATNDRCRQLVRVDGWGAGVYNDNSLCNFSKFSQILQDALDYGLTTELVLPSPTGGQDTTKNQCCCCSTSSAAAQLKSSDAAQTSSPPSSNSPQAPQTSSPTGNATSTPSSTGHLCWDPTLALPKLRANIFKYMSNICGRTDKMPKPNLDFKYDTGQTFNIQIVFRSPYGVYKYLGQLLREHSANRIVIYSTKNFEERELNSGPFLNITEGANSDCMVTAFYNGQSYCVPRKGSNSTGVMLDILGQLKNLSTSTSDINAATAVRLIN